jgi:uncharacterized protein YkwD
MPVEMAPERPAVREPADPDAPEAGPGESQSSETAAIEQRIVERINAIRREHGLNALAPHSDLANVARGHSRHMAERRFFNHLAPDGTRPDQRVSEANIRFRTVGENIFRSTNVPDPVELAIDGWMASPGHRENILRDAFTHTGVGVWQKGDDYYVTQKFMRPGSPGLLR